MFRCVCSCVVVLVLCVIGGCGLFCGFILVCCCLLCFLLGLLASSLLVVYCCRVGVLLVL